MTTKLTRKVVVLIKKETTYGVDPVPTPTDNAVLVNADIDFIPKGDKITRDVLRNTLSPAGSVVGAIESSLKVTLEGRGGGWDTDNPLAPELDPFFLACGMRVDTTVTGQRTYWPVSDIADQESYGMYFYKDSILHAMTGIRGTWSLKMDVGKIPLFTFNLSGLWVDPIDSANPESPVVSTIVPPTCVGLGAQIGSYSPVGVNSISLDLGAKVTRSNDINATEGISKFVITGREPTGSLDPEVDILANFNPWSAWRGSTSAAIQCTVGSVAGNRFDVGVPYSKYTDPKYSDRDGINIYNLGFECTGIDDDELYLTFR